MANRNVIVKQGQTVFDIVTQEYGDQNYLQDFLDLNDFHINHNLRSADVVIVDTDNIGTQEAKDYYNAITAGGKKRRIAANYIEYAARDYSEAHFNSNDYS